MNSKLVFGYWNIRGLGERIRLLLEYFGLQYEQVFYLDNDEDKWFKGDKPKLISKYPAVNLPYLIEGDELISESTAILIYLCHRQKRTDLLGRDAKEQVLLATAMGIIIDFQHNLEELLYNTETKETWEQSLKKFCENNDVYLKKLSGLLGNKEFICGGLTYVDFILAELFQALRQMSPGFLASYSNLLALQERVWAFPQLSAYFSSNRWRNRPVNGEQTRWK